MKVFRAGILTTGALLTFSALVFLGLPYPTFAAIHLGSANTASLSQGLVAYYPLDGSTINWATNQVNDVSGHGSTRVINGLATTSAPISGVIGQALKFNGSTDYLTAPTGGAGDGSIDDLVNGKSASFAFWIKPGLPLDNVIIGKNDSNGAGAQGWWIENSQSQQPGLRFVIERGTTNMRSGAASPPSGVWTHVVIVYPGNLTGSSTRFYYNGVLQALTTGIDGAGSQGSDAPDPLRIAKNNPTNAAGVTFSDFLGIAR
jgi:hypothetical protein